LNFKDEAYYRLELAQGYLERARKALQRGDNDECISNSQLSVENSAKAVISCFRMPSWSHDLSGELIALVEENIEEIRETREVDGLLKLADYAHNLAPEHGRMSYGDPVRRIPPWRLATPERAREALNYAEESFTIAKRFLSKWFLDGGSPAADGAT